MLKADKADNEEWGSGKKWLQFIITCSVGLYLASFIGIILLYKYFAGCAEILSFCEDELFCGNLTEEKDERGYTATST